MSSDLILGSVQEWEFRISRGNVHLLEAPLRPGANATITETNRSLSQLAAKDDMVDL